LDPARIAALQAESERVTVLLSKVFEEEAPAPPILAVSPEDVGPESSERRPRLLGLDAEHSAFLRVLLTRHSWSRAELNDIAADMEMMLDGALERVNEAALETFDARIAEGDDPIEIARDLMESVCV
jgi:TerB-C domain